jgi:hypothetical protein
VAELVVGLETMFFILPTQFKSSSQFRYGNQTANALTVGYNSAGQALNTDSSYFFEPNWYPKTLYPSSMLNVYQYFRSDRYINLDPDYMTELQATVDAIVSQGAIVEYIIDPQSGSDQWNTVHMNAGQALPGTLFNSSSNYWTNIVQPVNGSSCVDQFSLSVFQYGNPALAVQNADFSGYNSSATLNNLQNAGLSQSLQAQVLSRGGFLRVYDINNFITQQQQVVTSFYNQTLSIVQQCQNIPDPVTTTTTTTPTPTPTTKTTTTTTKATTTTTTTATTTIPHTTIPHTTKASTTTSAYAAPTTSTTGTTPTPSSTLIILTPDNTPGGTPSQLPTYIGAAVGGAAAIGGAAAAVVLFRRRRPGLPVSQNSRNASVDNFGNLHDNPLYNRQNGAFENPLYEQGSADPIPLQSASAFGSSANLV